MGWGKPEIGRNKGRGKGAHVKDGVKDRERKWVRVESDRAKTQRFGRVVVVKIRTSVGLAGSNPGVKINGNCTAFY